MLIAIVEQTNLNNQTDQRYTGMIENLSQRLADHDNIIVQVMPTVEMAKRMITQIRFSAIIFVSGYMVKPARELALAIRRQGLTTKVITLEGAMVVEAQMNEPIIRLDKVAASANNCRELIRAICRAN
ncbi:MAG: hypothetical protein WC480_03530 [Patescibacteria group bacterium]